MAEFRGEGLSGLARLRGAVPAEPEIEPAKLDEEKKPEEPKKVEEAKKPEEELKVAPSEKHEVHVS